MGRVLSNEPRGSELLLSNLPTCYFSLTTFISTTLHAPLISGFLAGATGTAMNCWCDVCRSVLQKQALQDTFDPSIPRPSFLTIYNPGPFFGQASSLFASKGIGGLYAGVGPKMIHLGGSGAILAVLMPRFKTMWFEMHNLY